MFFVPFHFHTEINLTTFVSLTLSRNMGFVFEFILFLVFFFTVLEVSGAEGLVRETISWMARRSLSRWSGLLMPISLWISVSDKADMMAPLFTLARQAATYQAGIPTHSWWESSTEQQCHHHCFHKRSVSRTGWCGWSPYGQAAVWHHCVLHGVRQWRTVKYL